MGGHWPCHSEDFINMGLMLYRNINNWLYMQLQATHTNRFAIRIRRDHKTAVIVHANSVYGAPIMHHYRHSCTGKTASV